MTIASKAHTVSADGITAPLRDITFRRVWLASLLSNLGILIQGVGAAWAMTQMTSPIPGGGRWHIHTPAAAF
jgi:hypothetical protein